MFGFLRRKPRPPEWASFMPADDYIACEQLIADHLRSLNLSGWSIVDGIVVFEGRDYRIGLMNLMQACHRAGREHWLDIIRDFFSGIVVDREEDDLSDFGAIQPRLTVRVYPEDALETMKENLLYRRHIPGTASVLCIDGQKNVRSVNRAEVGHWPMNYDELFAVATDNTFRLCQLSQDSLDMGDGLSLHVILSDDPYAPTFTLRLERFPELIGDRGTIIAMPTASIVLVYPFNDVSILSAIPRMIAITSSQYEQGPQSLSNRLYWRQPGGGFIDLPWSMKNNELVFSPPPEFLEELNGMGGATS